MQSKINNLKLHHIPAWVYLFLSLCFLSPNNAYADSGFPDRSEVSRPGLISCSLVVKTYEHWINLMPTVSVDQVFPAFFILRNKSGETLEFDMLSRCFETENVQFELVDANNNVIWEHIYVDPLLGCPDALIKFNLAHNEAIGKRVSVPLFIDNEPLEIGLYTLRAYIDGTPVYAASATVSIKHAY